MVEEIYPLTPAIRFLKQRKIPFTVHSFTAAAANGAAAAVDPGALPPDNIVKSIVLKTDHRDPLLVMVPGNKEVAMDTLALVQGALYVMPCTTREASEMTGYLADGVSPFGLRRPIKIYMERALAGLPRIFVSAGRRDMFLEVWIPDLLRALDPILIDVAV